MDKDFLVIHTPGAFGNYVAYLIDSHIKGEMLPAPFVDSGASHNRGDKEITYAMDVVIPGVWEEVGKHPDKRLIGCVWQSRYFQYILHAYYSRTNNGQYGQCGIEYCQEDFYGFIAKHFRREDFEQDIKDLKKLFGITINEQNRKVPRHVLRMFFWYKMIEDENNTVTRHNQKIKQYPGIELIDISEILDYTKLQSFFAKRFDKVIDFKDTHDAFLSKNRSLHEYNKALQIFKEIKNGAHVKIDDMSVMGEAMILFYIEKHFFDIPFHTQIEFFSDTKQVIEYVKYFPHVLRQPNKLCHKHYKRFPPNDK